MTPLTQTLLDQFPALPEHEATWRALYMEPVMFSGERIAVAVIGSDCNGCEVLSVLSPRRLQLLFGAQADGVANMIDMVLRAAVQQAQNLDEFSPPLSGFYLGAPRVGMGDTRLDVLRQAASLISCFYGQDQVENI